ncbi:MAG: farnesyl diphosphate synthase [Lysobacteraceae bacterium]
MTLAELDAIRQGWIERCNRFVAAAIERRERQAPSLADAMRHATLDGGKRMRPLLVYAAGTTLGADPATLDAPAAAIELVHAYSLVHDDLPAMDNDALRRGKPTVHVVFGEANAILAGDALLTLAFEVLTESPSPPATLLAMVKDLAQASGMQGMVAGQAIDLAAVGQAAAAQPMDAEQLRRMHGAKTGALIRCAVRLGALAADTDEGTQEQLDAFASALGLAFQIRDDILDVEGDPQLIGKTVGKDAANHKPTYPALLGMDASHQLLEQLVQQMHHALDRIPADTRMLGELARFSTRRSH